MSIYHDAEHLRLENNDLRAEVRKLRGALENGFRPEWDLTIAEKIAVALTISLAKHIPNWPGATDEQLAAVSVDLMSCETEHVNEVAVEIQAERERQKTAEGWTAGHDDEHDCGEMARAAAAYCISSSNPRIYALASHRPEIWPWEAQWWKPKDSRRDLVRAGALIVAEIERLDRLAFSAQRQIEEERSDDTASPLAKPLA